MPNKRIRASAVTDCVTVKKRRRFAADDATDAKTELERAKEEYDKLPEATKEIIQAYEAAKSASKTEKCRKALVDPGVPIFKDLEDRLVTGVKQGEYSELAAFVLSVVSTWEYSTSPEGEDVLLGALGYLGFETASRCYKSTRVLKNDPLLVQTNVSFVHCGKVGILSFRGTEPTNPLAWLGNLSFEPKRFHSWGNAHGGFLHSVTPVWPWVLDRLGNAIAGKHAPPTQWIDPGLIEPLPIKPLTPQTTEHALPLTHRLKPKIEPMEALYICGHSFGAAQAVLVAAMLYQNPSYACVQKKLRGVYCYGQPLVGDREFCNACDKKFGRLLFRHIYGGDIMTRLPPRLYGEFINFGQEYVSTPNGWTRQTDIPIRTELFLVPSILFGIGAWVAQQVPVLRRLRDAYIELYARPRNRMPASLADHSPHNYVECSRLSLPFNR